MNKFKVGDKVVCHKFQTTPGGIHWAPGMDEVAGKTGTIQRQVGSLKGWIVKVEGHQPWSFPEEALTLRPQPHKHAELIKAWADGAEIQELFDGTWRNTFYPRWHDTTGYFRIKPEPKPDVVLHGHVRGESGCRTCWTTGSNSLDNVKAIFDGETGKLKAVEILA